MGLILRAPREGEPLGKILAEYFEKKISTIECTQCKRVNADNGTEKITVIKFPRYLMLYIDSINKHGLLKHPLKDIESAIDITAFAEKDDLHEGQRIVYDLQAILAHPQNKEKERGVYTAVVKKRVEGERKKQWIKYHKGEQKIITKHKAMKHTCQVLFYRLKDESGEKADE